MVSHSLTEVKVFGDAWIQNPLRERRNKYNGLVTWRECRDQGYSEGHQNWNFKVTDLQDDPYTGCPRRKGPNFGRVFLRSNYTDITQNTYIQSSMGTEILNIEKWGLVWCLRTVLCPWRHTSRIRSCIPTLSLDAAHCDLGYDQMLAVYSG